MKLTIRTGLIGMHCVLGTSAAFAAWYPSHHQEREYYHDAAKTQHAGHTIQWCSGRFSKYGKITEHYTIEENFPCRGDGLN